MFTFISLEGAAGACKRTSETFQKKIYNNDKNDISLSILARTLCRLRTFRRDFFFFDLIPPLQESEKHLFRICPFKLSYYSFTFFTSKSQRESPKKKNLNNYYSCGFFYRLTVTGVYNTFFSQQSHRPRTRPTTKAGDRDVDIN